MLPFPVFGRGLRRGFGRASDGGAHITSMLSRILTTQSANLIGYWPLGDLTGTVADDISPTNADGAYAGSFALNQDGIGDGSKSVLFSGGRVSLATPIAALNTAFDPLKGTLLAWVKMANASVWTDGVSRILAEIGVDANNRIFFNKPSANNRLDMFYNAGGVSKQIILTSFSPINFFSMALTWDKNADQVKSYINGVQNGATATGLGVWAGSLTSGFTAIADFNSAGSGNNHSGFEAHVVLSKIAYTAAEVARIGILSAS